MRPPDFLWVLHQKAMRKGSFLEPQLPENAHARDDMTEFAADSSADVPRAHGLFCTALPRETGRAEPKQQRRSRGEAGCPQPLSQGLQSPEQERCPGLPRPSCPVLLLACGVAFPYRPDQTPLPQVAPPAPVFSSLSERPSSSPTFHRKPVLTVPTSVRSFASTLAQHQVCKPSHGPCRNVFCRLPYYSRAVT